MTESSPTYAPPTTVAEGYAERLRVPGTYVVIGGLEVASIEALADRTAIRVYFADGSHLDISLPVLAPLDFSWAGGQ